MTADRRTAPIESVRAPFEAGPTRFSPSRYTSPDFAQLEQERLWPNAWLLAGLASDVAAPGNFFRFDIGRESVIVARDHAGTLNAFHDVCQHRGQRLAPCRQGNAPHFRCRYHGWRWGLDGRLEQAPEAGRFPMGIPPERRRLSSVKLDLWAGFVWIHLGEPKQSLREWLGPVVEQVAPYAPETFSLVGDVTAEWPCNWKLAVDAFSETYHITSTHEHLLDVVDPARSTFTYMGPHSRLQLPFGVPARGVASKGLLAHALAEHGLAVEQFGGDLTATRKALQAKLRERGLRHGVTYEGLEDEQLSDTNQYLLFPNVHLDFHGADRLSIFRYRPHPTNPERSYYDLIDLVRPGVCNEIPTARPAHRTITDDELPLTIRQDAELLRTLQTGMHSRGFRQGWVLHENEGRVLALQQQIDLALAEAPQD